MSLPLRWRLLLSVFVALTFGLASLMYSERFGRLSMDLQFDDVSYAMDGVWRHQVLFTSGVKGLLANLAAAPPHSPLSALLAAASFSILGVHELSLYAGNLVVLLAAAVFLVVLTRYRDDGSFVFALALVFGSALAFHAQTEYRPDVPYGLLMAAMCWSVVSAAVDSRPRLAAVGGILFGAALLAKPSFFPHTLAIALMLGFTAAISRWRRMPEALRPLGLGPASISAFFLVGLALAAPYYYFGWQQTFGYFWQNTFGSMGHVHNLQPALSPWQVLQSFKPHLFQLARYHFYAAMIASVVFAMLLAWRGQRREALRVGMLAAVGFVSTVIILAGRQASLFFFATAVWVFFAATICGYSAWVGTLVPRTRTVAHVAGLAVLAVLSCNSLVNLRGGWPQGAFHGASANVKVIEMIRADRGPAPSPAPAGILVFALTSGPLNPVTLRWVGVLNELWVEAPELQYYEDIAALKDWASRSDYLVLIKPDMAVFDRWLPISRFQQALLDWADQNADFQAIGNAGPQDAYKVYARRARTALPRP